jgi:hypothetical protein
VILHPNIWQTAEKLKTERGFGVRRLVAALVTRQFHNVLEITFEQDSKAATSRRTPKSFFSSLPGFLSRSLLLAVLYFSP